MKDLLINIYQLGLMILVTYVSGWLMFLKPLFEVMVCNSITGLIIAEVILKIMFALPIGVIIYALGLFIAIKIFR